MKYAKKMLVVPFSPAKIDNPQENYILELDNEMSEIIKKKLPVDQKMKMYSDLLVRFKETYDPIANNPNNTLNQISQTLDNLVEKIKKDKPKKKKKDIPDEKEITLTDVNNEPSQLVDQKDEPKLTVADRIASPKQKRAPANILDGLDQNNINKIKRDIKTPQMLNYKKLGGTGFISWSSL